MTLRRHNPDVHDEAFAPFVDDVRAAVPSSPHEETAGRHLAAMRAAAEESRSAGAGAHAPGAGTPERTGRRRSAGPLRPVMRLGAVTAGALVAFSGVSTGLAAVGVELPDPVRAPFETVGIELPNQPADDERATPASQDERDDARRDREHRDGEAAGERSGGRGERGRSGERRGKGRAHGRNGTQPGKDGTRGRSEEQRRDDTAPNNDDAPRGDTPSNPGARRRGSGPSTRGETRGAPHARPKPDRARPTGPKQRVRPRPTPKPKTITEPATDPADVAPSGDTTTTATTPTSP